MRKITPIIVAALLAYVALAWFAGNWLNLSGTRLWIFRGALWTLGLMATAFVVWFLWNREKQEKAGTAAEESPAGDDISALIREARSRLPREKGQFGSLPVVFILGEAGSTKTSTILHSGLDAELLAGQVYQESAVAPTRGANLWYAKGTIFVELGGSFVNDAAAWGRVARALQPRGMKSAVSGKSTAPSAALVTVDIEPLSQAGSAEDLAAVARRLRARLTDIAQAVGVQLPVYVLFTRSDRVRFFVEYTRHFTEHEVSQVLGATVPMIRFGEGAWAEQETARLNGFFDQLFRSLAENRLAVLSREFEASNLPGAYEFPREFRKLRRNLVQFLVDLCRPSQLNAGPFLRGFYFSGVRPQVITETVRAVAAPAQSIGREAAEGATSIFRVGMAPTGAAGTFEPAVITRRVPQWIFLSRLFNNLLLGDQGAQKASGVSAKTSVLRRVLLASACALCLLYSLALVISWSRNHQVEAEIRNTASGIAGTDSGSASLDALRRLESLRQSLARVTDWRRNGAPLSFHWGLYTVDDVYPHARAIYFENFQKLLLAQTQKSLLESLRTLPATPGPDYAPTYDTLKAYLITTSNPDKSTRAFLAPLLTSRWSTIQPVDNERVQLARRQFEFYSDELKISNPFSGDNDGQAIAKARRYLNQFEGLERVYAAMLADAGKNTATVNFNRQFPGSAETVLDNVDVPGAFTRSGWDVMRASLKSPEKYFSGEQWVLGNSGPAELDRDKLGPELAGRYYSDYVAKWRAYLKAASLVRYGSLRDASRKLNVLSSNQSTLLALFSLASQNTAVDVPDVASPFQPVQAVVPPGSTDRFIAPPNQPYMTALLQLQTSLDAAAQAPELNDQIAAPALMDATAAHVKAKQLAQSFRIDKEGQADSKIDVKVAKLLDDPITYAEGLLRRVGPDELNGKGKALCGDYRKLLTKYPFSSSPSAPPASLAEVNAVFRPPDGALWVFYDSSLRKLLVKQGSQYVPAPGASGIALNPAFVRFFNDSAALSEAWYAGGTQDPHFSYTLKPLPMEGIQAVGLQLDGQTLNYSGGAATPKQFTWQGRDKNEAGATVRFGGQELSLFGYMGLWAVFQAFAEADISRASGDADTLEWVFRSGKLGTAVTFNGKPVVVRFELNMAGSPPVFQKGYFSRTGCVADVAK